MKKSILLFTALMAVLFSYSQSDIIYTVSDGKIIFDCDIIEVKDDNIVFYLKDSLKWSVEAKSIVKDGVNIELVKKAETQKENTTPLIVYEKPGLYRGHDYDYYERKYRRSKQLRNSGIILNSIGFVGGALLLFDAAVYSNAPGANILIPAVFISVGTPLWISGSRRMKNNMEAMEKAKASTNLSFAATQNGIGLILSF